MPVARRAGRGEEAAKATMDHDNAGKKPRLGVVSGVYIPVCLNILSILMFLRFGLILGQIGLLGTLGSWPPTPLNSFSGIRERTPSPSMGG